RACRAVVPRAGLHALAFRVTRGIGMARLHVVCRSLEHTLDIRRRERGVLFEEKRAHPGELRRSRGGSAEYTPAIVRLRLIVLGGCSVDLARGRYRKCNVVGMRQHADQTAEIGYRTTRVDGAFERARVVGGGESSPFVDIDTAGGDHLTHLPWE